MREDVIRNKIRSFIIEDLMRDEDYALENDEGIITGGLMDSFSLAELGVYIEEEFEVYIPDADLTIDQMDTLDQIVARVVRGLKEE